MSVLLDKLNETRATAWEIAKTHLDTVEATNDDNGEAEASWQRMSDDLDKLDARIAQVVILEQRAKDAEAATVRFGDIAPPAPSGAPADTDEARLASMVSGEVRGMDFGPADSERRDLTKLNAAAGLNTVPTSFYGQLYAHMIDVSAIRQSNVTVLNTASGEALQVPKTSSFSTAAIVTEGAAIAESDPAFGQVTMDAFKYSFATQISSELETDTGVDLLGFLAMQGGRALGNTSGAHFITGSGAAQPNGVVTAATVGVTGGAAVVGAFTADNLIDLYYSVISAYRKNGSWLMSDTAIRNARKLKDTTNQYLWSPGLEGGEVSTLMGAPVLSDVNVAVPALSARSVLFGDLSTYLIRDVQGVRVERSTEFAFLNDLVTYRFILRTDGDLVDTTGSVKVFVGNAA